MRSGFRSGLSLSACWWPRRWQGFIPLSALAGVLVVLCWNVADKAEFLSLLRNWPSAIVLLATFGLTMLRDLTTGIVAGCVLAAVLVLFRRKVAEEGT